MRGFDFGVPMFMVNIAAVCSVKFFYHPAAMGLVYVVTAISVAIWAANRGFGAKREMNRYRNRTTNSNSQRHCSRAHVAQRLSGRLI